MSDLKYYDGTKLLSMLDADGEKPEIYICTSNNTAGKTTYFNRYALRRFINHGEKFMLLFRYKYELSGCAENFMKGLSTWFPDYDMESKMFSNGMFARLILLHKSSEDDENPEKVECGYAVSLSGADNVKKKSHFFSDTSRMIFDEFMPANGFYMHGEVDKLRTIHIAVARGEGKQSRYVPVIMIANPYTKLNPYYMKMGITQRLRNDTRFMKGHGFVLEQSFNRSASEALKSSGFMKAFSQNLDDDFSRFAADASYLDDSDTFVEKMPENGRYLLTIKYNGGAFSIKKFDDLDILYVSDSVDKSFPVVITISVGEHSTDSLLLSRSDTVIKQFRSFFDHGRVRFKNQICKNAFLKLVSYDIM